MKIGRNEPCWCGSGRKFKRCHLNRDSLPSLTIDEIAKEHRSAIDLRVCLAKGLDPTPCSGGIVRAHSLSRRAVLERISRKQHVYGFRGTFMDRLRNDGLIRPQLVGVKEASAFTGFCEGHDGRLFKKIDAEPLVPTGQQLGLLAYRALCREMMGKLLLARTIPGMREMDRGREMIGQMRVQATADEFENHVAMALPDLRREQTQWHQVILGSDWERVSYALIRLSTPPDVVCCGVSQPDKDFRGRVILDLRQPGTRQDDVAFGLIPTDEGGFAFFAWLDHFPEAEEFVGSLLGLSEDRIVNQLVRYVFETFDNGWLAPAWWESLPAPEQNFLVERMNTGGLPYLAGTADPYSLLDNGMSFVNWRVTNVERSFH